MVRDAMRCLPYLGRLLVVASLLFVVGCISPGERARLVQAKESLRRDKQRLERMVAERNATIASLHQQVGHLQAFGPDRPADLFAPDKLEIVSRSRGADYDDRPGDDGVTVYLRLRDADGDVVKAPGAIAIQLLDNTSLDAPTLIGLYRFDDEAALRRSWYGKFGTGHYTLKCPFPPGHVPPRRIDVKAEFVDFLTGKTLTAVKEVNVSPRHLNGAD